MTTRIPTQEDKDYIAVIERKMEQLAYSCDDPTEVYRLACTVVLRALNWYSMYGEWPTNEELPELMKDD
jgi:hypothetical protein